LKTAVAKRVTLGELEKARYFKSEGEFEPNYATLESGEKISRVNCWGNCVRTFSSEQLSSISIDDFSAAMDVLAFGEERALLENVREGDVVSVVGKPREGNRGVFIALEGIQKLSFEEEMLKRLEVLKSVSARKHAKGKKKKAGEKGSKRKEGKTRREKEKEEGEELGGFTRASELTVERKVID